MIITEEAWLAHFGTLRKSGRYPYGSGGERSASAVSFLDAVAQMRKDGMTDTEIAKGFGLTTTRLRAIQSVAGNEAKLENIATAEKLKAKGMSNVEIGKQMGINESSVRSLLAPGVKEKADILFTVSNMLEKEVGDKTYVDIGAGVENQLKISDQKLKGAVEILKEKGYVVHNVQIDQASGGNNKTTVKVLCPPGTTYRDVASNKNNIQQIQSFSEDGGRSILNVYPPKDISSKRVDVVYSQKDSKGNEIGGGLADGVIYVRPGVEDVSIGNSRYAQVRISVDGTHYLKGMAVYKDDLPAGVDLQFNTNKTSTGNKLDAMKKQKDDPDNPFGSIIRQKLKTDEAGNVSVSSALNIVGYKDGQGEEGSWATWRQSLSTQLLSKQSPKLAQQQLDVTYDRRRNEFDAIMALTNPTVKQALLEKFADGTDSAAVHLKAAALPRQATQVIMPINTLKPGEVYAPNFRDGETVALIRYPHGGTFEIPELVVNNKHKPAITLLGEGTKDAIGINPKVAERLSGADFDGDTVVVIPNGNAQINSTPALKQLKDFDPQKLYKLPADAPQMKSRTKGIQMGAVSNLITDMTIKGAGPDELARAVKHSMVVIDAEKHHLDYKRSAVDNGISALQEKYQDRAGGRASTIISKATSDIEVDQYKLRSPKDGGPIDPATGRLVYRDTPEGYTNRDGVFVTKKVKVAKLANTLDGNTLIEGDGTRVEKIYADHSNRMKALANEARKEVASYKPPLINRSAKKAFEPEVKSLVAKLNLARENKPLERQAQIFAAQAIAAKKAANPDMDNAELKKIKSQALAAARVRTQAAKKPIVPTPQEWAAIQAGAVSANQLREILKAADIDAIKELATPRTNLTMPPSKVAAATALAAKGYTQAEIADHLGVSLSTLTASIE